MQRRSVRPSQNSYYGGEPMQFTNSHESTCSNISYGSVSSTATISTAATSQYESFEPLPFISSFNTSGMAGAGYADMNHYNQQQRLCSETNLDSTFNSLADAVPTPSNLGWALDSSYPSMYQFFLQKGELPYLELLPEHQETRITPRVVYLDESRSQEKNVHPCMYPSNCLNKKKSPSTFRRPADLWRHYTHIHEAEGLDKKFFCAYPKCERATKHFTRKDHTRNHLKDFHKDDIGFAKREKYMDEAEWEREQKKWLEERIISPRYWICAKCLHKIHVKDNGWNCPDCKMSCEPERIEARKRLGAAMGEQTAESFVSYENGNSSNSIAQPFPSYGDCTNCSGTAWLMGDYGEWVLCPNCETSDAPYDGLQHIDYPMELEYSNFP